MVDVRAELQAMPATLPRKIVGVLIPFFRAAYEAEWLPAEEREARNVNRDIAAARVRRKVVEQTPASVLETKFVDFGGTDRPQILRRDARIAERLLRSAGEGILPKILGWTLRIHLDAGNSTRAGAAPQREVVRAVEMVVQT